VKKHQLKNGGRLELAERTTAQANARPDSLYDRLAMRFARRDGKTSY
jgi:hypothetical protein